MTYPDALAEKVVSRKELGDKTLKLHTGENVDTNFITEVLRSYGFEYVDYVYEPGQYAVRGSIIDVFSFSSEFPYRIDFFGDEVESIRTFEVETQLSKERKDSIVIVPDLSRSLEQGDASGMVSFLDFCRRILYWQCVICFGCVNVFRLYTMKHLPHKRLLPAKRKKVVVLLWMES